MMTIKPDFTSQDFNFSHPVSDLIWREKYQYRGGGTVFDKTPFDTFARVAKALAKPEPSDSSAQTTSSFFNAMKSFALIPAGRILAGAGTMRDVTLSNTFVMTSIPDSVAGIMDVAKDAALTMKMGGGLGYDFSSLRPAGLRVKGLDCGAAGPVAAMEIFNAVCGMVVSGMGRGAMMATLRCDHPDILAFISAKADPTCLRNFNMSVTVSDAFMKAVETDGSWDLKWKDEVFSTLPARVIWQAIMERTYAAAEPGVLFIDKINAANPLNYLEEISATNSCAEQPLPPNGTCPLASINLARLVRKPFTETASLDLTELKDLVSIGVRLLDNTLDMSRFANVAQKEEAMHKRRIGLGVTAVADALAMLGVTYGSLKAARLLGHWMRTIQNAAYAASAKMAAERGVFPAYRAADHLAQPMTGKLDPDVRELVVRHGLRNGTLTSIAPTGTISMLAGNVSSGIEPIFSLAYKRTMKMADGSERQETVEDYAVWLHRVIHGPNTQLPKSFVTTADLDPVAHVRMQAAAQEWIDGAISKTVNCPEDMPFDDFKDVYRQAYVKGCKGCTTFRPNAVTGAVLTEV